MQIVGGRRARRRVTLSNSGAARINIRCGCPAADADCRVYSPPYVIRRPTDRTASCRVVELTNVFMYHRVGRSVLMHYGRAQCRCHCTPAAEAALQSTLLDIYLFIIRSYTEYNRNTSKKKVKKNEHKRKILRSLKNKIKIVMRRVLF